MSAVDNAAAPLLALLSEIPSSSRSQAPRKISQLLVSLNAKGKTAKAETKKLQKLCGDVISDRQRPDAIAAQRAAVERGAERTRAFRDAACRLLPVCQFRARIMNGVLGAIQGCSAELAAGLRGSSQALRAAAEAVDSRRDFEGFVARSALIRFDLQCNPFVPIDLSHPVFADIDTRIQVAVPPIYPVGVAAVVDDFVAEGGNELSITRGKHVLLMEEPGSEWVFVMNPLTRATGYAPAAAVEKIGQALAVVVEVGAVGGDAYLQRGDYLAVKEVTDTHYKAVTTRGEQVTILRDHAAVIYG
jgi:hypothetical protein